MAVCVVDEDISTAMMFHIDNVVFLSGMFL